MAIPLIMAAAAGAQGLSTLFGGAAEKRQLKARALAAGIERDTAMLQRTQLMGDSRAQLQTVLGTIDATRSTRGASLDSQTGDAIRRRTMADAYRDEGRAALAYLTRAGAADQARRGYSTAARWAMPMAVLNSIPAFAQAGAPFMPKGAPAPMGKATNSSMRTG
ncbi:MAG: hypothetical protein K2X84_12335 [Beijerinckiaceae bacterium]|nr:hypothetical protein [Beijerinckiaceae bacterium]